jgi:3-phosphoshikimate 1-carboxyvinyltransferase
MIKVQNRNILESFLNLINNSILMSKPIRINNKKISFNKKINIEGDKSLSIRWALLASQATGISKAYKILRSEDVLSTLNCLKKLGVKIKLKKEYCEVLGKGLNSFKYKNNITLDVGNSGTLGRLLLGLLVHSKKKIKLVGDKSLSKRDFSRVIQPLKKFGATFDSNNKSSLPLSIMGSKSIKPINYFEYRGSAQCKSSVMLAALNTPGETSIKAKKSRDHTELFFKYLKVPIKIKKTKKFDFIKIKGVKKILPLQYKVPADISSTAFFIVLTALSKNSTLLIRNVNINPSRIGVITILKKMGIKIFFKNKKNYKGENVADIFVKSSQKLNSINCPSYLNSSAIDEFLIIFLVAAKATGVSYFKDLSELNQKESPRLEWGSKILNMMGVKTKLTHNSIKIYGNPDLEIPNLIKIRDYLKDHRIFMMSTIAALTCGGKWEIHDPDSIKTSFPSFLKIIKKLNKNEEI